MSFCAELRHFSRPADAQPANHSAQSGAHPQRTRFSSPLEPELCRSWPVRTPAKARRRFRVCSPAERPLPRSYRSSHVREWYLLASASRGEMTCSPRVFNEPPMFRLLSRPIRTSTTTSLFRRAMATTPDFVRRPQRRPPYYSPSRTEQAPLRSSRRDRPRGPKHHRQGDMAAIFRPRAHCL